MPITYDIYKDGRFVHAVGSGIVTDQDILDYETAHATDERIKAPACELLEIKPDSFKQVTQNGILKAIESRKKLSGETKCHRCAIVVSYSDHMGWDLAKFYEAMAMLHSPCSVIVFGELTTAKKWLGVETVESKPHIPADTS